jgi:hypothetical protein
LNSHFVIIFKSQIPATQQLNLVFNNAFYSFYVSSLENIRKSAGIIIYYKGYVIPRNDVYSIYSKYNGFDLIEELYRRQKDCFTQYIKGNFIIVIIDNGRIKIYTDHFGFLSCFYSSEKHIEVVSDSIMLLRKCGVELVPDGLSLVSKSLLHRNVSGYTSFIDIVQTKAASFIEFAGSKSTISTYWTYLSLLSCPSKTYTFGDFAGLLKENFIHFKTFLKPKNNVITLTGGKDSRTGLAALLALGIQSQSFTYGNKESRDAIYAKQVADKVSLKHYVYTPPCTEEWYDSTTREIISYGNPEISIHRAHRLYAFKEMSAIIDQKSAFYAGYMAGEFLMGIYYDNLVFTKLLTDSWESTGKSKINQVLKGYYNKIDTLKIEDIVKRLMQLKTFDSNLSKKERQFHAMFEIGIPHHCQDVFLSGKFFNYVYPFFIDIDFLEALFKSNYNFFFTDNKTSNLFKRYKLFEFNLNIQHILYPDMDEIPFGKRGSYNTKEFLKGRLYWAMVKSGRYLFQRQKYPVSLSYDLSFRRFLSKHLADLESDKNHILHNYFNISEALKDLKLITGNTGESVMHKFSNIVTLYLQLKKYTE